ncbi:MAG: radical SAM protein [Thermodesulfobacteriota bacterium]|nr:radical SAM protein [Thermodesulfobacteriota bacterium]
MQYQFELGPIRPPSEARSLLLRITRNCPWNKCEFCSSYKGTRFEIRTVEEVKEDIRIAQKIATDIKELSKNTGYDSEINREFMVSVFRRSQYYTSEHYTHIAWWLFMGGKTVFIQDANSLVMNIDDLDEILQFIKETFPSVERITTYARAKTVSKIETQNLMRLHDAGLSRIHIGLETGYDPLLVFINKGVTAQEHVDAGIKVKKAGISLSEYVILGLGGKKWSQEHALATAEVLNKINPDFIRMRTLALAPRMAMYQKLQSGEFEMLLEDEIIEEEKLFIEELNGITSHVASDHVLNLLEEVEGKLPEDKLKMLETIDQYLTMPHEMRLNFKIGKREGLYRRLSDQLNNTLYETVERRIQVFKESDPKHVENLLLASRGGFI